jgi:hypothetical protein
LFFKIPSNQCFHDDLHNSIILSCTGSPGLSILILNLKKESKIKASSSSVGCGRRSILRFTYNFIQKLHLLPGDIVKKTEGGPKLYHMENNLVLASFAASSVQGTCLHAALTV